MPDRQNEQEQREQEERERQERERRERERREQERQQQEQEEQQERDRVEFDSDDERLNNPEAENVEGEYEFDVDPDTARQTDIDGVNLEEEEAIIEDKLEPGHYIDGDEVEAIHNKYEKVIDRVKREAEKEEKEAKANGKDFDKDALEKKIEGLKDQRNKEIVDLCANAKRYNSYARDMLRRKQLRDNELQDRGRTPRPRKVYRKEKGQDKLTTTIYGKNRVGEINKLARQHEKNAAKAKGEKARHQGSKVGQGARDFTQGDAEHMFKGSVSMGLHAALYLLHKLAQARKQATRGALYLYALYKLNTDDIKALQKALNDTSNTALNKDQYKEDYAAEAPNMEEVFGEPFECRGYEAAYADGYDVAAFSSWYNTEDGEGVKTAFCGSPENLRKFFEAMGTQDVEQALERNAEVMRDLDLEDLVVENIKDAAQNETNENKKETEGTKKRQSNDVEPVIPPGDVDARELMGEAESKDNSKGEEQAEGEAKEVDLYSWMEKEGGKLTGLECNVDVPGKDDAGVDFDGFDR